MDLCMVKQCQMKRNEDMDSEVTCKSYRKKWSLLVVMATTKPNSLPVLQCTLWYLHIVNVVPTLTLVLQHATISPERFEVLAFCKHRKHWLCHWSWLSLPLFLPSSLETLSSIHSGDTCTNVFSSLSCRRETFLGDSITITVAKAIANKPQSPPPACIWTSMIFSGRFRSWKRGVR